MLRETLTAEAAKRDQASLTDDNDDDRHHTTHTQVSNSSLANLLEALLGEL